MSKDHWLERCDRRTRELVRLARRQGWQVSPTSNSHVRFKSPQGTVVIASAAKRTLDQHYYRTVSRLKREGFVS